MIPIKIQLKISFVFCTIFHNKGNTVSYNSVIIIICTIILVRTESDRRDKGCP